MTAQSNYRAYLKVWKWKWRKNSSTNCSGGTSKYMCRTLATDKAAEPVSSQSACSLQCATCKYAFKEQGISSHVPQMSVVGLCHPWLFQSQNLQCQQPTYQPLACILTDSWLPFTIMLPYPVENSLSKAPLQKASARNQGSPSAAGRYANFAIPATQRSPARATTVLLRIWNIQKCLQNCPSWPQRKLKSDSLSDCEKSTITVSL